MAATGVKLGANHIAIFGGASGHLFKEVEQDLPQQISALKDASELDYTRELTSKK